MKKKWMSYVLACLMAISLMQPSVIMAASRKKKVSRRKTVPAVSLITAQVDRSNKAKAKITLKWKRVKGAKSYQISLQQTKFVKKKQKKGRKVKIKKVKKTYNKWLKTVKSTTFSVSEAYNKTYTFTITAINGKLKSKGKIIKVKAGKYTPKKTSTANKMESETKKQETKTSAKEETKTPANNDKKQGMKSTAKEEANTTKKQETKLPVKEETKPATKVDQKQETQVVPAKPEEEKTEVKEEPLVFPESLAVNVDDTVKIPHSGSLNGYNLSVDQPDYVDLAYGDNGYEITGRSSGTVVLSAKKGDDKRTCLVSVNEKYTYNLVPLLAPFGYKFLLQTEDPDPLDLCFIDTSSKYCRGESSYIECAHYSYIDVGYVDESLQKVKGGYLFGCDYSPTDGGDLIMKRRVKRDQNNRYTDPFTAEDFHQYCQFDGVFYSHQKAYEGHLTDTAVTLQLPALQDRNDYLLSQYTTANMTFFEKMNAIDAALRQIGTGWRNVYNTHEPTGHYPKSTLSYGAPNSRELSQIFFYTTTGQYKKYESQGKAMLAQELYPFALEASQCDSLMQDIAKQLEPDVNIVKDWYSETYAYTLHGQSQYYHGYWQFGYGELYDTDVTQQFRFNGAVDDFSTQTSLESLQNILKEYRNKAEKRTDEVESQLYGDDFKNTIKAGAWIKVGDILQSNTEKKTYAYVLNNKEGLTPVTDAWVDGHYINTYGAISRGAHFSDHAKASIILTNQTYTNAKGENMTGPMAYEYNSKADEWVDYVDYFGGKGSRSDLPEQFVLSRDEVNQMTIDTQTDGLPEHGFVYDGSQPPGTPF